MLLSVLLKKTWTNWSLSIPSCHTSESCRTNSPMIKYLFLQTVFSLSQNLKFFFINGSNPPFDFVNLDGEIFVYLHQVFGSGEQNTRKPGRLDECRLNN